MNRTNRTNVLLVTGAAAVLVSGWVHFYLYFRGGYRGIAPESVAGLTISRSFALNAIAALLVAEALVLATRYDRLVLPASAAGALFGVATLGAYFLSRTTGLLGFEESSTSTEAVAALVAEVIAIGTLTPVVLGSLARRGSRAAAVPA